jgi:hypothetical protein
MYSHLLLMMVGLGFFEDSDGSTPTPPLRPVRITPTFTTGPQLTPTFTTGPTITPAWGADA